MQRINPSTVQITASNDGLQFSAYPLIYIKGSGSFSKAR